LSPECELQNQRNSNSRIGCSVAVEKIIRQHFIGKSYVVMRAGNAAIGERSKNQHQVFKGILLLWSISQGD